MQMLSDASDALPISPREQFGRAATAYRVDMYRLSRSILDSDADAEDAVSEALLRAWQSFHTLRAPDALKSWLLTITANCAREQQRKTARIVYTDDFMAFENDLSAPPDTGNSVLWDCIMTLPGDFRAVTVLYYFEDLSTKEIARTLGIRAGTVRSRLARARAMLKKSLESEI